MKRTPLRKVGKVTQRRQANLRKLKRPRYCQGCGLEGPLDPHHIIKRSQGGDEGPENIKWLCRMCHEKVEPSSSKLGGIACIVPYVGR